MIQGTLQEVWVEGRGHQCHSTGFSPSSFPSIIHPSDQSFSSNATLIMLSFYFKYSCAHVCTHTHTAQKEKLPSTYRSKVLRVHSILLDWTLINFSYYTRCSLPQTMLLAGPFTKMFLLPGMFFFPHGCQMKSYPCFKLQRSCHL